VVACDVIARRHPEAEALREVHSRAVEHGTALMREAQAAGRLRPDVTADGCTILSGM
jgi:hypothetical protein